MCTKSQDSLLTQSSRYFQEGVTFQSFKSVRLHTTQSTHDYETFQILGFPWGTGGRLHPPPTKTLFRVGCTATLLSYQKTPHNSVRHQGHKP